MAGDEAMAAAGMAAIAASRGRAWRQRIIVINIIKCGGIICGDQHHHGIVNSWRSRHQPLIIVCIISYGAYQRAVCTGIRRLPFSASCWRNESQA